MRCVFCFLLCLNIKSRTKAGWRSAGVCVRVCLVCARYKAYQRGVNLKWTDVLETAISPDKVMKYEIFNAFHLASLTSKSECAPHWKRDIIQKEAQRRISLLKSFFYEVEWSILELFDVSGVVPAEWGTSSRQYLTYNLCSL